MKIKNKKLTEDEFFNIRKEVLSGWPTGKDIDLKESAEYIKKLPENKNVCCVLKKAKEEGITLAQPRAGVALLESHIELLKYLQDEGGADMLPSTIDSYTRQNRYDQCEIEIEESKKAGRSMLNGFPAVNYGKDGCRKVIESVNVPVQARHGTPDSRLLAEIIHSGGWTSNEGGGISYNIPYAKNVSIEKSLTDWQYCDRLVGMYEEMGAHINREPFGPLTGTLVPPSMSNAVSIIEGLLAAEQGVKNITLGYGQCGYIVQDVAAMKALYDDAEEYFKKYGYDIELTTVFHEWMGGFPEDESKAFGLISLGAASAALSGATKVIVKTPHEAYGIPTKEANAAGIKATKEVLNLLKGQRFPDCRELHDEIEIIKSETQCILNKVYELGDGDIAVGTVKAFESGVIDVPFAPSKYNLGLILPARDNKGSVRYLDFGNLPFNDDIKDFNRRLLEERGKHEKRSVSFKMTVDDIYAVSKGFLVGRPGIEHLK